MSGIGNKIVFSRNLKRLMDKRGVDRNKLCADLSFKYSTVSEWLQARKYPRIDKIEKLAAYFGVLKSDLIEDPASATEDGKEEYLLAARSKDGKQAVRKLTKKQYEIAVALIESLELNEDENL